ncbi:VpsR-related response regulator [uncultured Photobacterium sp.]|uniref:sigma-54-dependent transcriptional regulator n=1 Tax=uncultured Photobacterium sp. TaxID=173973 RepID=UPI0026052202|nr:VpsR-related response regulator [uncultured Photobacterium sp.]
MVAINDKKKSNGRLVAMGCTYEPWIALLEQAGWKTHCCYDLRTADVILKEYSPCVCIVDLSNNDFSLNSISQRANKTKHVKWIAIIKKEQLKIDAICQFINNFCVDFFSTPIPSSQLLDTAGHQLGMLEIESTSWVDVNHQCEVGLYGESKSIKHLRDMVKRVSMTDVNILLSGEQGVGKALIAKTIHNLSKRRNDDFTIINCSSLSDSDQRTHFLDPQQDMNFSGTIKSGTVLFNGVEELSKPLQLKLRNYLQQPENEKLNDQRYFDVRIITSSSVDLEQAVKNGTFNKELYYRLNVFHVAVPTLRERGADIILLAEYYLKKFSTEYSTRAMHYSEDAKQLLLRYNWPGNVRELINQVKRVSLLNDSNEVNLEHFDLPKKINSKLSLRTIKDEAEKDVLVTMLETHKGQVASAAKDLGVSRATMYRLLNKHNIIPDVRYYNDGYAAE